MIPGPNWAQRYGSAEDRQRFGAPEHRLCARAGCGAPATATLRFQPTRREAWLVVVDNTGNRSHGDLCARHADTLVLPRGWDLYDERARARARMRVAPAPPARTLAAVPDREPAAAPADLAEVLDARTPLLRRAFQNVWPLDERGTSA